MRSRPRPSVIGAAVAAALVTVGGYAYHLAGADDAAAAGKDDEPVFGPGDVTLVLDAHHSLFGADEITVRAGTRVRFVVVNHDPIAHELIVGDDDVHAEHAAGTHPEHPPIPGEVSVGPLATGVTTFEFEEPGIVEFACHLPGHYEHGMHGRVVVVD